MDKLRYKYNPEHHYQASIAMLDTVTKDDATAWFNHPCTKCLRESLEGDMAGIVISWIGGAYSDDSSSDSTAQLQAKARGQAQAIEDVLEQINDIRKLSVRGDLVSDGN